MTTRPQADDAAKATEATMSDVQLCYWCSIGNHVQHPDEGNFCCALGCDCDE